MTIYPRHACAVLGLTLLTQIALAADLNWGVGGAGGAGTWDNGTNLNWFNGANVGWSAGNTAVFGGSAGTVTVSGSIPGVQGMTFNTGSYLLSGTGFLNLSGTTPTITVGPGLIVTNIAPTSPGNALLTGGGTLAVGTNAQGSWTVDSGST